MFETTIDIWDKVLENGPSKICGKQPYRLFRQYSFKFFKGCLHQILVGPFLNTLTHISFAKNINIDHFIKYSYSQTRIFPYKNGIYNFLLIRENMG